MVSKAASFAPCRPCQRKLPLVLHWQTYHRHSCLRPCFLCPLLSQNFEIQIHLASPDFLPVQRALKHDECQQDLWVEQEKAELVLRLWHVLPFHF